MAVFPKVCYHTRIENSLGICLMKITKIMASMVSMVLLLSACQQSSSRYSPKYDLAFSKTLVHEGGYCNDENDKGGETKYGISQRSHSGVNIKNLTIEKAKTLYYAEYWVDLCLDNVREPEVAGKILDICVNFGKVRGTKVVTRALRAVGVLPHPLESEQDWELVTYFVNMARSKEGLLAALRSESAALYRMNAEKDETQQKFLNGWLARAYR